MSSGSSRFRSRTVSVRVQQQPPSPGPDRLGGNPLVACARDTAGVQRVHEGGRRVECGLHPGRDHPGQTHLPGHVHAQPGREGCEGDWAPQGRGCRGY